jgi:WD40 repeat protein
MFAGFSNGKIVFYRKKHQDPKSMLDGPSDRDHETVTLDSQNSHKGDVRKLIFTRIEGLEVLISGSADSTIKLWEPMNQKTNSRCFQTIIGHAGTILDMIYLEKVQLLVTSSTDNTMKIWRVDKARNLLLYPWFVQFQQITEFSSVKSQSALEASVWVQCFDKK